MADGFNNEKRQAHELIERLARGQVAAVVGLLEAVLDPVSRAIANAPVDDEPETDEERRHPPLGPRHRHAHLCRTPSLCGDGEGDLKKLKGESGEIRLRVGDYRVRFTDEPGDTLRIHSVRHRKDAYR
jgi:hypothetical protein